MSDRSLDGLLSFYESHLRKAVLPFWFRHALEPGGRATRGIQTCLADDGRVLAQERYLWSQLRAIFTFSALYNHFEQDERYLRVALDIAGFAERHGRDEEGRWMFAIHPDGRPHTGHTSIYSDGFALMGYTELYRATGDHRWLDVALATYRNVLPRLTGNPPPPTAPYEIPPGLKTHGVSMIFSLAFHELALATGDAGITAAALDHADQVMHHFYREDRGAVVEFVTLDGQMDDSPAGRAVVPGHAIESMWFQIHQYAHLGRADEVARAARAIGQHMAMGWDREHGGLLLGLDLEGIAPPYWKFADTKLWWPHTEALYALLLAHAVTGDESHLEWYWRVHDVAFAHYPVAEHGEWTQRLDRRFKPLDSVVALPVKDPFHLPRALVYVIRLLRGWRPGVSGGGVGMV